MSANSTHDDHEERERAGLTRRQLLAAGAGMAGVAAGAGLVGSNRISQAQAATPAVAQSDAAHYVRTAMQVAGQKQGQFKGDTAGTKDITIYGITFEQNTPYDSSSGRVEGRTQLMPVIITKEVDQSSPQFLTAQPNDETLTTVQIKVTRRSELAAYYEIKLVNAHVVDCMQFAVDATDNRFSPSGDMLFVDQITLVYQKITIHSLKGNTSFTNNWQLPG